MDPLAKLCGHTIFSNPSSSSTSGTPTTASYSEDADAGLKQQKMVVAGKNMVVVVGDELRIMSLKRALGRGNARGRGQAKTEAETHSHEYKILKTRSNVLPSTIFSLHANSTGKLLAVVGDYEVVVLKLPEANLDEYPENEIRIEPKSAYKVATQTYNSKQGSRIVKVQWHPWGAGGYSLLILSEDAILREVDVSESLTKPIQAFSFLPPPEKSTSSRKSFGVLDDLAQPAVSFTLGVSNNALGGGMVDEEAADWGPLTVWGLMANGDVWSVCPFMPANCAIPHTYIASLQHYLHSKRMHLETMSQAASSNPFSEYLTEESITWRRELQSRLKEQEKFVKYLTSQYSTDFATSSRKMGGIKTVSVHPPKLLCLDSERIEKERWPARQGPFLVNPESRELDEIEQVSAGGIEGVASDIFLLSRNSRIGTNQQNNKSEKSEKQKLREKDKAREAGYGDEGEGGEGQDPEMGQLGVIGVVWVEGKVDICLELEGVEALWATAETEKSLPAPALVVLETVDLGLLSTISDLPQPRRNAFGTSDSTSSSAYNLLSAHPASAVLDPLEKDTIYIRHALGVHQLNTAQWRGILWESSREEKLDELETVLVDTQVKWLSDTLVDDGTRASPIIAAIRMLEPTLPPTLLVLTEDLTCTGISLMSTSPSNIAGPSNSQPVLSESTMRHISTLAETPFDVDEGAYDRIIRNIGARQLYTKQKLKQPLQVVNSDDLRTYGTAAQKYMEAITAMKNTEAIVEGRLDLQTNEVSRQLGKLKSIMEILNRLRSADNDDDNNTARWNSLSDNQTEIMHRLDAVYQDMQDTSQPLLSNMEHKWFAELGRMNEQITGNTELGISPMSTDIAKMQGEIDTMKPSIVAIKREEARLAETGSTSPKRVVLAEAAPEEPDLTVAMKAIRKEEAKLNKLVAQMNGLKQQMRGLSV